MAVAKKKAAAKPSPGKAMINWTEELGKYATEAEAQEDTAVGGGGMKRFSTKSGVLSFDDAIIPGNKMGVVILDSMFEHSFYEGKYDPNNPAPPLCFALGRDEGELVPHKTVFEREQQQNDACEGCPMNEFGSADTGRGKACKNVRRLAIIPAGTFDKHGGFKLNIDPEHYSETQLAFLKVMVTSTNAYKAYVKQISQSLRKPLFAIATQIHLVPDPKNQVALKFEALEELPMEVLDAVFARVQEAKALIETPMSLDAIERAEKPARGGRQAPAKKAAKKGAPARVGKPVTKAAAAGGRKY
jgi:hypothetical protein